MGALPIPCRLFFIGCWNFADDYGVIKGNAALLKSQIFPYDENLRVSEVRKWLGALVEARMLVPVILDDARKRPAEESYYVIRTFRSHQVLDSRYHKSYISKDENYVNSLIDKALAEHGENTACTRGVDGVNTAEEMERNNDDDSADRRACEREEAYAAGATGSPVWTEDMRRRYGLTEEALRGLCAEFVLDCRCCGKKHTDGQDFKQHFNYWLRDRRDRKLRQERHDNGDRQGNGAAAGYEQRRDEAAGLVARILAGNYA